jgi:hypothetical protein
MNLHSLQYLERVKNVLSSIHTLLCKNEVFSLNEECIKAHSLIFCFEYCTPPPPHSNTWLSALCLKTVKVRQYKMMFFCLKFNFKMRCLCGLNITNDSNSGFIFHRWFSLSHVNYWRFNMKNGVLVYSSLLIFKWLKILTIFVGISTHRSFGLLK